METPTIPQNALIEALKTLMDEAYLGPARAEGTWFVDNELNCGFVGMLDRVTAAQASKTQGYPEGGSIAAHAFHIRFALGLVVRASRGENPYENADWKGSWKQSAVNDAEWKSLREEIRAQVAELKAGLAPGPQWENPMMLTGCLAVVAHGAWHLGSIRQLIAV